MAEHLLPKQRVRVRFPLLAPLSLNLPPKVVLVVQFKGVFIMKTDKSTKIRIVKDDTMNVSSLTIIKKELYTNCRQLKLFVV